MDYDMPKGHDPSEMPMGSTGDRAVHSRSQMQAIMQRERTRTDRNGNPFSLVIFEETSMNGPKKIRDILPRVLLRRARLSDEIGWLGGYSLGVVQPDTDEDGAHKFAQDVTQEVAFETGVPPIYRIRTYPKDWISSDNDKDLNFEQHDLTSLNGKSIINKEPTSLGNNFIQHDSVTTNSKSYIPNTHGYDIEQDLELLASDNVPFWKRSMDMVLSAAGLVALSPLLVLIAVAIKLSSPGPVFFKQERIGVRRRPFTFLKFRSMHLNADTDVHHNYVKQLMDDEKPMTKLDQKDDPRIFPLGKILRQFSLDELPQLFNVLWGEMSIVGPRPPTTSEAEAYLLWQTKRFDTLPGITGLWQVSGKNETTFKEMIRLDIAYQRQRSFWFDLSIMFRTVPVVLGLSNGDSALKSKTAAF